MHFYIGMSTPLTDENLNVVFSYPLNTYATYDQDLTTEGANDGRLAVATGVKLFIPAGAVPADNYVAAFTLRMTPFYKAEGGNEVDVVVNTDRNVRCWVHGSETGQGYCRKDSNSDFYQ